MTIAAEDTQLAKLSESLYAKVSDLTGAPRTNIERISLEKRNSSDNYKWIPNEDLKGGGSRVLMIYISLNTVPEALGGKLEFASMKKEFAPVQGQAILIPCVRGLYHRYEIDIDTYSFLEEEARVSFLHNPLSGPTAYDTFGDYETSKYGIF
eukprot:CAMPEP_0116006848 /NCGR_PEP_ID=MMETSP0321-20121206/1965_1 /TAXON_ID=163516 /ORGANISM="Leptocylindrus danicus var. danicus, Strain B650" /LENGTH=151 /DNA_ID=CAMNT_0003475465 /DNA_START=454 /DNA_END=906 /DNA_ORIENTATION=+